MNTEIQAKGGKTSMGQSPTVAADVAWLRAYGAALGRAMEIADLAERGRGFRQIDLAFQADGKARKVRAEIYRSLSLAC